MSKKVAIIYCREYSYYNFDDYMTEMIASKITDWETVSDEDYDILVREAHRLRNFIVLQAPEQQSVAIANTVSEYINYAKKQKALEDERKARYERERLARKLKKEAKTREDKLALLKQLQDELGRE